MGRDKSRTRLRILDAAFECFYRSGFSRVSVDEIAEKAGLTKRTVYSHFESKDQLAAAVFERQSALSIDRIEGWASGSGNSPRELVDAIFTGLRNWASGPNWNGSGFSRIAIELAELPGHPARRIGEVHKMAFENWLADRCAERGLLNPEAIARQVAILIEGAMVKMLIHGDTRYATDAFETARRIVEPEPKRHPDRAARPMRRAE